MYLMCTQWRYGFLLHCCPYKSPGQPPRRRRPLPDLLATLCNALRQEKQAYVPSSFAGSLFGLWNEIYEFWFSSVWRSGDADP